MEPSILKQAYPLGSVIRKTEAEIVAQNIILILSRTGDKWRKLDYTEYEKERLKDGNYTKAEKGYFDKVIDYCLNPDAAKLFCPSWKKIIDEERIKFKFWKDNKLDQEFTLSAREFKAKYLEWLKTKEKSWLEYYGFNIASMHYFIGDKESEKGLQCVSELEEAQEQWDIIQEVRVKYFLDSDIK